MKDKKWESFLKNNNYHMVYNKKQYDTKKTIKNIIKMKFNLKKHIAEIKKNGITLIDGFYKEKEVIVLLISLKKL